VRLIIEDNRPLTGIEKAADAFVALPDAVTWDLVADHDIAFHRSVLAAAHRRGCRPGWGDASTPGRRQPRCGIPLNGRVRRRCPSRVTPR
jgi:hypothetical protein